MHSMSEIHLAVKAGCESIIIYNHIYYIIYNSVVDIVTRYRLDGPGIESRWGRDFPQPSRPAPGPTQPPIQCVRSLSWG
jgi:hypothetical protein